MERDKQQKLHIVLSVSGYLHTYTSALLPAGHAKSPQLFVLSYSVLLRKTYPLELLWWISFPSSFSFFNIYITAALNPVAFEVLHHLFFSDNSAIYIVLCKQHNHSALWGPNIHPTLSSTDKTALAIANRLLSLVWNDLDSSWQSPLNVHHDPRPRAKPGSPDGVRSSTSAYWTQRNQIPGYNTMEN